MQYNRGGKSLKVGDIGRSAVLRQLILAPGERMTPAVQGFVQLSGLRQRSTVYAHARIDAFATPIRWLDPDFTDYITEGVTTAHTLETLTGSWVTQTDWTSNLGVGRLTTDFWKVYAQAPIKIWNEWYRHPETARESVSTPDINFYANHGKECVNLPSAATRVRNGPTVDPSEYQVDTSLNYLDPRDLARMQGRLHQAAVSDWTSQDRYQAFMRDIYGAQGSNEVDQVPIRLRSSAELSVRPRDLWALDKDGLGEKMGLNNFSVSHRWSDFIAPEHMVITFVMLIRFHPIFERGVTPFAYPSDFQYSAIQGDPVVMAGEEPVPVRMREVVDGGSATIGYLPHGWQWREGFHHVDERYALLNNFPLLDNTPVSNEGLRDASLIGDCFRSTSLRHWNADLDFQIAVSSAAPPAGVSIVAGTDRQGPRGNHPDGGWMI